MNQFMHIGDLTKLAGVTRRTVRYYESIEFGAISESVTTPIAFFYLKRDVYVTFGPVLFSECNLYIAVAPVSTS